MSYPRLEVVGSEVILKNKYARIDDTVVMADLHLGKTMHFRKSGIAIPAKARMADQNQLYQCLKAERPERLIVVGDLFHSGSNSECEELATITSQFQETSFELVLGNHDILDHSVYRSLDFETSEALRMGNLLLTHEPLADVPEGLINIHGHIHPGIRLTGRGRQSMMAPCFHWSGQHFCLPAFGELTGLAKRIPMQGDRIYAVFGDAVQQVT